MHRIPPTAATVVAILFALLLVIYVFAGGKTRDPDGRRPSSRQVEGSPQADPATPCASQKTYDLVKSELFRQASDLRGDDANTYSNVASYSFLRMTSPRLIGRKEDSGVIGCVGSLVLDLPPGLSVAGGRRSLTGNVAYAVRPATGAGNDVVTITGADAIITPLATLSRTGGNANKELVRAGPEQASEAMHTPVPEPAPRPEVRPPAPAPVARPAPLSPARTPRREPVVRPREQTAAARPPVVRSVPVATAPLATAKPSFNCRSARTRGEIAVCGDGSLASLDRQMAGQFNRAFSAADPGKRSQLQRSRGRFLRFRDNCSSDACVAGAYRDRMREIDDIVNERWSPR